MRLSWNEIRARSARFAEDWKGASYERGETQTFYNEFFEVFGVPRKKVAIFEELRKAHTTLDLAVDRLYRKEPFETDRARVEFLLARYEQITAPALALAAQKPKRAQRIR